MNGPVASSNASQEARCAIAILNSVGWNLFASWPAAFKHLSGAVAFLKTPLTNGAIEAVNGLLQLAKRLASGFRSLLTSASWPILKTAGLHLNLPSLKPSLLPTQNSEWPKELSNAHDEMLKDIRAASGRGR